MQGVHARFRGRLKNLKSAKELLEAMPTPELSSFLVLNSSFLSWLALSQEGNFLLGRQIHSLCTILIATVAILKTHLSMISPSQY
jgi:hypothetical protein